MGDFWDYNNFHLSSSLLNYNSQIPTEQISEIYQYPDNQYQSSPYCQLQSNEPYIYQSVTLLQGGPYSVPTSSAFESHFGNGFNCQLQQNHQQTPGSVLSHEFTRDIEDYSCKSRTKKIGSDFGQINKSKTSMDSNGNGSGSIARDSAMAPRKINIFEPAEDLDFIYDDCDTHANEIAELYSYTENSDLQQNLSSFEEQMNNYRISHISWRQLSLTEKSSIIMKILNQLELSDKKTRIQSAKCILYIAQGGWLGLTSDIEVLSSAKESCLLLYKLGTFSAFIDLLNLEMDNNIPINKTAVSITDSENLRVILTVLYSITEVIRSEREVHPDIYNSFCSEIMNGKNDESIILKLLDMLTKFCSGVSPHFPIKKVLLLLWKLILLALGGTNELRILKAKYREKASLPAQVEDTMEIMKSMRPSSPPSFPPDLLEDQNQRRKRSLVKQSSLEDNEPIDMEIFENEDSYMKTRESMSVFERLQDISAFSEKSKSLKLPWKPKVHKKEIDLFLNLAREKFIGYSLEGDDSTMFGLPKPIHDSINTLREHIYTPLAELQTQKEEVISRNPFTAKDEIELTPAEALYQAMFPNLPQYMICLLKILLATTSRAKTSSDSINILGDVLPKEMPLTAFQTMKLGIDVNRHKEIIVKAVSGILLLLLKHFKLNHIYQFEFMSQHLVFANCIPLILKFFNQEIMMYVKAANSIPILDFPSCILGDQSELNADIEIGCDSKYCWRNVFSSINLLRVLNKLCKWKNSRIMMLVVFKSAPILKRTLKMRQAMAQLYILKLLKMQTKYLGRNWRKSNLKTVSLIYQKVRHHLNDDWAYGNFLDAKPWDFQAEEISLRSAVDRFNSRRYMKANENEFEPVDSNLTSALGLEIMFSENFQKNYHLWLEDEVFRNEIDWDKLF
nr:striatin-interacting protein 1 homolog [Leptinotarsa decemlineata]